MKKIIKMSFKLVLVALFSVFLSGCLTLPVYVEPTGENTANLIVLNKTIDTETFKFVVYEHSKQCTGESQYDANITSYGMDRDKRRQISMKIPARKDFTFKLGTYLNRSVQRCYFIGTFNAKKGRTYVATLKNNGVCTVQLSEKIRGSNKLVPEKSFYSRWPIVGNLLSSDNCSEGEWINPLDLVR